MSSSLLVQRTNLSSLCASSLYVICPATAQQQTEVTVLADSFISSPFSSEETIGAESAFSGGSTNDSVSVSQVRLLQLLLLMLSLA